MARVALIGGFGDLVVKLRGSLIAALREAGHEVIVSVPPPSVEARAGVEAGLRALGARLVESPLDRTGTNIASELAARAFYVDFMHRERPDAVPLSNKLRTSEHRRRLFQFALSLQGGNAVRWVGDPNAVAGGKWQRAYFNAFASTIGGGTSQIQANIVGERVLGLPKD